MLTVKHTKYIVSTIYFVKIIIFFDLFLHETPDDCDKAI